MTKFIGEGSIGQVLGPAMEIADPVDAKQWKDKYVTYLFELYYPDDYPKALEVANANLGYYAGYYDEETRRRVEKLFNCEHPVFGSVDNCLSIEEIFRMGYERGFLIKR